MRHLYAELCVFVALSTMTACASHPAPLGSISSGMNMPNPSGCYVKVFDREQFRGAADFINGPRRYATLDGLPRGARWNKRIRSVQVGPGAVVTVWADEKFKGPSLQMRSDRRYGFLMESYAGRIKSMDVSCAPTAPA